MATLSDITSGLVLRAQNITSSEALRILNDDIIPDITDDLYISFDETFVGEFEIPMITPGAPSVALTTGTLESGSYRVAVSFVRPEMETMLGAPSAVITLSSQGGISITSIPIGGSDQYVAARNIYIQKNGMGSYMFYGSIADNTTTTYTINTPFSALFRSAKPGIRLPADFEYELALKYKDDFVADDAGRIGLDIPFKRMSTGDSSAHAWIDYDDYEGTFESVAASPVAGCRFTSQEHGLTTGDSINIVSSTVGSYITTATVTYIDQDTFDIEDLSFSATATGKWKGSAATINFDSQNPFVGQDLVLIYRKKIANATELGELPFPRYLQGKLMPALRLGMAYYYLMGKPGSADSDQVMILQERYLTAKANIFNGSISYRR